MDFAEQLRILQAAQGSPALLALATVDLVHHALAAAERTRIKEALVAAAVPHWCDRDFLVALLETTSEEGDRLLGHLCALTVVEPFPARGEHAVNVHEAARLALREHLRTTDAANWKALSIRARAHVGQGTEPHTRIESLYHLFAIDQPAAAVGCEALAREFSYGGRPEVRHALALALQELTAAGWLTGSAEVEARLAPVELRGWRGETAQLESEARHVADLAHSASDPSGIGRAQCVLGDVLKAKGRLDAALVAFREYLAAFQHLTSTDPSNTDWQRELAVAHSRVGDIYQEQGRLDDAANAFREYLAVTRHLASTDPSHGDWQRELAVAHTKVGNISQAQGRLDDALAAYREFFAISQRLASTDPSNATLQRDLAVAHVHVGDINQAQGHLDEALGAFREALEIALRLAATDPANAGWQRDLAVAHSRIGDISQAQGRFDDAMAGFREYFAISQRLASTDASNADWLRGLAVAHNKLGQAFQRTGNEENAQSNYRSAVDLMERAAATSPGNVEWKQDLVNLRSWLK